MAEQFIFKQLYWDCSTINGKKWALGVTAQIMQSPGAQFLTRASLARDKYGTFRLRQKGDLPLHGSETWIFAYKRRQSNRRSDLLHLLGLCLSATGAHQ